MRKVKAGLLAVVLMLAVIACASETPWKKATVSTYELLGAGIGSTEGVVSILRSQNAITDAEVLKVKEIYNKTRGFYILAGNTLKLAGQAKSASERDKLLEEYGKLLADFQILSRQLYDMINSFKKVSHLEIERWIKEGGEI